MLLEIKAMVETQNLIPAQVHLQKPVILNDARGRTLPLHLEFIDSAEAFTAILRVKFKDIGHGKIVREEFRLDDAVRNSVIDWKALWLLVFKACCSELCHDGPYHSLAGQRVHVSMIFGLNDKLQQLRCPSCYYQNPKDCSSKFVSWSVFVVNTRSVPS
jgi:hypothetical protein